MKNLLANDPSKVGETRLKNYVVVSKEWYESFMELLAGLKLLAEGMYIVNGKTVPKDLYVRKMLIEHQFFNWKDINEPIKE